MCNMFNNRNDFNDYRIDQDPILVIGYYKSSENLRSKLCTLFSFPQKKNKDSASEARVELENYFRLFFRGNEKTVI